MIDRKHSLPITRQADALGISRGTVYYQPRPISEEDLALMKIMDRLHLEYPFAGSRMLRDLLNLRGITVGRRRVRRLMRRMGIEALYRKPNTSKKHAKHKIYPYLLRQLNVNRPNQVWAMDITYLPMARGFIYLAAVVDWYSRRVLSWSVSTTMDVQFCVDTVQEALDRYPSSEIFNTDQGSQFTSTAFTTMLKDNDIKISMDGKGCWRDNVFVERLWRTVKYEEVYLKAYDSLPHAKTSLATYFDFYNQGRPHSSLDRMTPDQVYFNNRQLLTQAA